MSNSRTTYQYKTLRGLTTRIRDDLNNHDFVLLFAYNGTGKTRLSMAFKDAGKRNGGKDTLYFNAFTEDLFYWHNDLDGDKERYLQINSDSVFFADFQGLALEEKIFFFLERYADFNFKIDYGNWRVIFSRGDEQNIKVSRGEQNIFIWCIFLAVCELAIEGHTSYKWVKNLYIDDPIHGVDDEVLYSRALNLLSHGKYSIYEPKEMVDDTRELFKRIFSAFLDQYRFDLPDITREQENKRDRHDR